MFINHLRQMMNRYDAFAAAYPALEGDYNEVLLLLARVTEQIQLHANTGSMNIALEQMAASDQVVIYLDDASDILGRLIDSI